MARRGDFTRAERRAMRPPFAYPRVRKAAIVIGILFIAWLGWTGVHVYQVVEHLNHAQTLLDDAQSTINSRNLTQARAVLDKAGKDTHAAREAANGVVWTVTAHVPILGRSFETVSTLTKAADVVARQALPPALDAVNDLDGKQIRKPDGSIDLARIVAAQPALTHTVQLLEKELAASERSPRGLSFIASKRRDFLVQLDKITHQLDKALQVSRTLPAMLGANGPRHYFMGFLVNAESRPTGGLLGSYAILSVDHGKLSFDHFGDHNALQNASAPVIDLGPEFNADYGSQSPESSWTQSTASPHFPNTARIWLALYQHQTGQQLDGALETDPVGLSYLLRATGPVTADNGEQITADNVVTKLENEAYIRYGDGDQTARKLYLLDVAARASQAVIESHDPGALFGALQDAASDNRIRAYMARGDEQAAISGTSVAGELPNPGSPLAYLVVQNYAANKMDFYLKRDLVYHQGGCGKLSWVDVTLTNLLSPGDAPSLPNYLAGFDGGPPKPGTTKGSMFLTATVYLDGKTALTDSTVGGRTAVFRQFAERGLNAFSRTFTIAPGASTTFRLVFGGDRAGEARIPVQPLVQPLDFKVVPAC